MKNICGYKVNYLVVVSCVPQQSSKGDCIGDAAQVNEEHRRDGLDVEAFIEVTEKPGHFTLDVQPQSATKSTQTERVSDIMYGKPKTLELEVEQVQWMLPASEFQLFSKFMWSRHFLVFCRSCTSSCIPIRLPQLIQRENRLPAKTKNNLCYLLHHLKGNV